MEAAQTGPGDRQPRREADVATAPAEQTYVTAPITANPAPLGLSGFALSTFILSMFNGHLVNMAGLPVLFGALLFYGGIAQFLAGMWHFRIGDTFSATVFGSYGAFWMALWAFYVFYAKTIPEGDVLNHAIGLYLLVWAGFTALLFIVSLRTTGAVALTVLLLVVTELVLGLGNNAGSESTIKLGGYIGLATAVAAWYTAFAILLESTFGRWILPVFPLSRI